MEGARRVREGQRERDVHAILSWCGVRWRGENEWMNEWKLVVMKARCGRFYMTEQIIIFSKCNLILWGSEILGVLLGSPTVYSVYSNGADPRWHPSSPFLSGSGRVRRILDGLIFILCFALVYHFVWDTVVNELNASRAGPARISARFVNEPIWSWLIKGSSQKI